MSLALSWWIALSKSVNYRLRLHYKCPLKEIALGLNGFSNINAVWCGVPRLELTRHSSEARILTMPIPRPSRDHEDRFVTTRVYARVGTLPITYADRRGHVVSIGLECGFTMRFKCIIP